MSLSKKRKEYLKKLFTLFHAPHNEIESEDFEQDLFENKIKEIDNTNISEFSHLDDEYIAKLFCNIFIEDNFERSEGYTLCLLYYFIKKEKSKKNEKIDLMNLLENIFKLACKNFKEYGFECAGYILTYTPEEYQTVGIYYTDILKLTTKLHIYNNKCYFNVDEEQRNYTPHHMDPLFEDSDSKNVFNNNEIKYFKNILEEKSYKCGELTDEIQGHILDSYLEYENIFKYCKYYRKYEFEELSPILKFVEEQYHPLTLLHMHLRKNYKKLYDKNLIFVIKYYLMLD